MTNEEITKLAETDARSKSAIKMIEEVKDDFKNHKTESNARFEKNEDSLRVIYALASSIEKLVINVEHLNEKQIDFKESVCERMDKVERKVDEVVCKVDELESKPLKEIVENSKKDKRTVRDTFIKVVVTVIGTAIITVIATMIATGSVG